MAQARRVLIYGGKGALGAKCVSHFKANNFVSVIGIIVLIILSFFCILVGCEY